MGLGYVELFGDNLDVLSEYEQEVIKIYQNNLVDLNKKDNIEITYFSWKQYADRLVVEYGLQDRLRHAFVLIGMGGARLDMAKRLPKGESKDEMLRLVGDCFSRIDDGKIKRANLLFFDLQNKVIPNPRELEKYIKSLI